MSKPAKKKVEEAEPEEQEYEPSYGGIEKDPDTLFRARYIDSLFGTTLFLRRDGRRRGLWVWLEEDHKARIEQDARIFEEGFKKFYEEMKKKVEKTGKMPDPLDLMFQLKHLHLSYFFDHRTEGAAVRLTWPQLRKFIKAATEAEKAEKEKTEDWDYEEE